MMKLTTKITAITAYPDFLGKDWNTSSELKEFVEETLLAIFKCFFKAVKEDFLKNKEVKEICEEIDSLSDDLSSVLNGNLYLETWLFIGKTIETWIDTSVKDEEFEVASNLKKILESDYV